VFPAESAATDAQVESLLVSALPHPAPFGGVQGGMDTAVSQTVSPSHTPEAEAVNVPNGHGVFCARAFPVGWPTSHRAAHMSAQQRNSFRTNRMGRDTFNSKFSPKQASNKGEAFHPLNSPCRHPLN
jgi:hypothetical protein